MRQVLEEFLKMPISKTDQVFNKFIELDGSVTRGEGVKRYVYIPGWRKNKVLLVAHADTYWQEDYERNGNFEGLELMYENGKYINAFGADDRAGCAILWLLKDLGHSLLITSGEENQQIGAKFLMEENIDLAEEINKEHQFIVEFDRRGRNDYKCYDVGTDEFRKYIEMVTGYQEPDRKSSTDIKVLCKEICGVNLSLGYYKEHTNETYLVYEEWLHTLNLARRWLNSENLPKFKKH